MNALIAEPDPQGNNKPRAIAGRDTVNMLQVNTLLSAINTFMIFLTNSRDADKESGKTSATDGGAVMAAEHTFIQMCNRLEQIITDGSRWGMEIQQSLEEELRSVYQAQKSFLHHQHAAVDTMQSPHNRFRPSLARLIDGRWAAFIGDVNSPSAVVGIGANPEEALRDFDAVFAGKAKIYEKTNKTDMDRSRDRAVEKTLSNAHREGDSGGNGPEPKIRGGKTPQPAARKPARKNRRRKGSDDTSA